jgi:hypothetical protein
VRLPGESRPHGVGRGHHRQLGSCRPFPETRVPQLPIRIKWLRRNKKHCQQAADVQVGSVPAVAWLLAGPVMQLPPPTIPTTTATDCHTLQSEVCAGGVLESTVTWRTADQTLYRHANWVGVAHAGQP